MIAVTRISSASSAGPRLQPPNCVQIGAWLGNARFPFKSIIRLSFPQCLVQIPMWFASRMASTDCAAPPPKKHTRHRHSQSIPLGLVATSANTDSAAIDRYECDSRSPDLLPSACGRLSCRPDRQKRSALECARPQSGQYPSRWQRPGLSLGRSAIGDDRFRDDPQRGESR
jgi:hypothetical protein